MFVITAYNGPSIFTACRAVPARDAAEALGIHIGRGGRARCPFCGSRRANMSFNKGLFHCFSCGAAGDAVKLTELYLHLRPLDAARWINAQFNCGYDDRSGTLSPEAKRRAEAARRASNRIAELKQWRLESLDNIVWAERYLREHFTDTEGLNEVTLLLLNLQPMFDDMWRELTDKLDAEHEYFWRNEISLLASIRECAPLMTRQEDAA